ncbi:MAG: 4Fe-4S binding protein [Deferribacteraceae bacterium]|jgi:2-oxoglutarate ferredoxin oxidoreductase subunit delta|nr:4Fe-4S binding protein [Deferribacteraceae bacterium]
MAKKGKVTINRQACKGCAICVHFCPANVLAIKEFKVAVPAYDKCIACMMCELRCPDFAIKVEVISE